MTKLFIFVFCCSFMAWWSLFTYGYTKETSKKVTPIHSPTSQVKNLNQEEEKISLCHEAISFHNQGNYKQALELYMKALKIDPHFVEANVNIGITYLALKKPLQAVHSFEVVLKKDMTNVYALNGIAIAYFNLKKYDAAINIWKKLIEQDPKSDTAYYNLALAYNIKNDAELAEQNFLKVIELNVTAVEAYEQLADIYTQTNQFSKARDMYEKSITYTTNDSAKKDLREKMNLLNKKIKKLRGSEES